LNYSLALSPVRPFSCLALRNTHTHAHTDIHYTTIQYNTIHTIIHTTLTINRISLPLPDQTGLWQPEASTINPPRTRPPLPAHSRRPLNRAWPSAPLCLRCSAQSWPALSLLAPLPSSRFFLRPARCCDRRGWRSSTSTLIAYHSLFFLQVHTPPPPTQTTNHTNIPASQVFLLNSPLSLPPSPHHLRAAHPAVEVSRFLFSTPTRPSTPLADWTCCSSSQVAIPLPEASRLLPPPNLNFLNSSPAQSKGS
jgi:hypothetical protein